MKHIQPRLSVTLVAVVLVGSACNQSNGTKYDAGTTTFDDATITVDTTAWSFPNTAVGSDSEVKKFTLSNIGFESTGPVSHVIDGINAGEFIITGSTCGQPLAYQATCQVSVVFRPVTAGTKSARLTASATPGKSFTVILNAMSTAPGSVRLDPTVYDFPTVAIPMPGDTTPIMPPVGNFTVTNAGGSIVGPLSANIDGADASDFAISSNACDGNTLAGGASCMISVRFKPSASGDKTANLNITGPGIKLSPATLSGTGSDPAKITLTPTMQSFGTVPVGMKSAFSFDVTNVGGADAGKIAFSLEGINISEFSAVPDASCNDPLKANFTCSITVTFNPTLPGPKTASLRVTASPGGFAKADLSANADMMQTDTTIMLTSPAPDPFGTVEVGNSSTGFFVVKNTGAMVAAGKVMAVLSGSNSNEFMITNSTCPDMLMPNASCAITVSFTPQLAGRRTANLQVTALPGGFAILPITGNATAPAQLSITPVTRNFNSTRIGQLSSTTTFQVRLVGAITSPTQPLMVALEGTDLASFQITYNDCQNQPLQQGRTSCRVDVRFSPQLPFGQKNAALGVSGGPGQVVRASLYGTALCPNGQSSGC